MNLLTLQICKEEAEKIVECEDASRALAFLRERSDFEYEYIEVITIAGV